MITPYKKQLTEIRQHYREWSHNRKCDIQKAKTGILGSTTGITTMLNGL